MSCFESESVTVSGSSTPLGPWERMKMLCALHVSTGWAECMGECGSHLEIFVVGGNKLDSHLR